MEFEKSASLTAFRAFLLVQQLSNGGKSATR